MSGGIAASAALFLASSIHASPVRIDFDMAGRPLAQVHEPGWNSRVVATDSMDTRTIGSVVFTLREAGLGSRLVATWNKTGVLADGGSRLVGDGVVSDSYGGGAIRLDIEGIAPGRHSLLTYHNATDTGEWNAMDVSIDGLGRVEGLEPSRRASTPHGSAHAYLEFDAAAGRATTVLFAPASTGSGARNAILNALALDVPDPSLQAEIRSPSHRDWHVEADGGTVVLSWNAARNAVAHGVYFGTDSATVADASIASAAYQGRQTATSWNATAIPGGGRPGGASTRSMPTASSRVAIRGASPRATWRFPVPKGVAGSRAVDAAEGWCT